MEVRGLYIKLNKKLIVQAENIDIQLKSDSKESSKEQISEILAKLPWIKRLFHSINIKNINLNGNHIQVLYENGIFYIDTDYVTIDTTFRAKKDTLDANISSLVLKDFNLSLQGIASGDIDKKDITFKGKFNTFNISGDLLLHVKDNLLSYHANSDNFTTLEPFMESLGKKVAIDPEAKMWIYKKITAKNYKLNFIEGKINIKTGNFYPNSMKGKAKVSNATIKFHENVPPAFAKTINIELKNNTLFFNIPKGKYQNIPLKNQKAHIYNLLTKGNGIVLNISTTAPLNQDIQTVLKAYKLNIPLLQKSGQTKANIAMDIRFVPYDIDVNGTFEVQDSHILLSNAPFYSKRATILLDNRLLTLQNTNLRYKTLFDINTDGVLDLYDEIYDGNVSVESLHVKSEGADFLHVKNQTMPVHIDIKKDNLAIHLPHLQAKLNFKNNTNTITQNSLSTLFENSPFMQSMGIYDGNFSLKTEDFSSFFIKTYISSMKPLLSHNKKPITSLDLDINIKQDTTKVSSKSNLLAIKSSDKKTVLSIKDADFLLDLNASNSSSNDKSTTILQGKNSNIQVLDHNKTILLDDYTLTKTRNNIQANATYKNGTLALKSTPDSLHVKLTNLNDTFTNTLIKKEIFNDGNFSLKLSGIDTNNLSGHINFKNTHLKSFKSYNNILAFINSVPALLSFKKPGFNEKGYQAKNADILFSKEGDIITLHTIDIVGADADIGGSGVIDMEHDTLDLKLKLKTLKNISDVVKNIPLVSYIFLGDDESIETAIHVSGSIENPKVTTQTVQDVVFSPFHIIKRTIKLPFKLLEQEKPPK